MERLIDAFALQEEYKKYHDGKRLLLIDVAPTVDAAPVKRGYWIRHDWADEVEGHLIPNYECSVCHAWKRDDSDYCPDCGARNAEEDNGRNTADGEIV